MPTVRVCYSDLRVPLEEIAANTHVHGRLEIEIDGELLPYLGFGGPDDVCFAEWCNVLTGMICELSGHESACFRYDEGELPAVEFERQGDTLQVSSLATAQTGPLDPWKRSCGFDDFREAASQFLVQFRDELRRRAPSVAEAWWTAALGPILGRVTVVD